MKPALFALPLLLAVAGCNTNTAKISSGSPELSLVGEGLSVERTALPAKFTEPEQRSFHSLWSGNDPGLFGAAVLFVGVYLWSLEGVEGYHLHLDAAGRRAAQCRE